MKEKSLASADKERVEREILGHLARKCPSSFCGDWEKGESPDFRKTENGRKIGLEITRYIPRHGAQTGWEIRKEDIRRRCLEITNCDSVYYCVEVWANSDLALKHLDCGPIANSLVEHARRNQPSPGSTCNVDLTNDRDLSLHGFRRMVVSSPISVPLRRKPPFWNFPQSGYIEPFDLRCINSLVLTKNGKLSKYRTSFDEHWLVIAGESVGLTSFSELPDLAALQGIRSDFTHTWLFFCASYQLVKFSVDSQSDAIK